jgi:hypothetical protein
MLATIAAAAEMRKARLDLVRFIMVVMLSSEKITVPRFFSHLCAPC